MVLNHPLPLCANTFVLLRDSAHCVMSIHNTRSEAMNVKSPVYTAIVTCTEAAKYHFSSLGRSAGRSLAKPRTNRGGQKSESCHPCRGFCSSMEYASGGRCDPNSYGVSGKKRPRMRPRWGIRAKRGSEKVFGFLPERGKGREGPLIPKGKSYVRCSDKSPSDRREENVQGM